MLVHMLTTAAARRWPAPTALMAVAGSVSEAAAAVGAGADLVDLGSAEPETIAEFRACCPGILVCAAGETADLTSDPAVALATGGLMICPGPDAARASRLPAVRLVVEVPPGEVQQAQQAGWSALVDADRSADLAAAHARHGRTAVSGIVAMAAVSFLLGAAVIRTRHPFQVRRALDMAACVQGTRPPARTVRGLA